MKGIEKEKNGIEKWYVLKQKPKSEIHDESFCKKTSIVNKANKTQE